MTPVGGARPTRSLCSASRRTLLQFHTAFKTVVLLLALTFTSFAAPIPVPDDAPALIKTATSTATGLLKQPPLDLSKFTTADFTNLSDSVGFDRIQKPWPNPVVSLPPHPRAPVTGLTEPEVKQYMTSARNLFDKGKAIPISDAGLISTQEDVVRKPMLNHIAAFSNDVARVYLLVQKESTDKDWGYFS